jgi:transposase
MCLALCSLYLGAGLIYLSPYSPNLNPIEETFSSIKAWLRRHELEFEQEDQLPWLIHQAVGISLCRASLWLVLGL